MTNELFFRSGQAAKELGISSDHLRALCKAAKIRAQLTEGGQYRIPQSEVERLKREGVPAAPRPLPAAPSEPGPHARPARHPGLLASPSPDAIDSAEQVFKLENEVKIVDLRRRKEEGQDWFRERSQKQIAREAQHERELLLQREAEERAEERKTWEALWIAHALEQVPALAPESLRLEVHRRALDALQLVKPGDLESLVSQVACAAAAAALEPWQLEERRNEAVKNASSGFGSPWSSYDDVWVARAAEAAREVVTLLPASAPDGEMKAAAMRSVQPLYSQYRHEQRCATLLARTKLLKMPSAMTTTDEQEIVDAMNAALRPFGPTSTDHQVQSALDAVIEPVVRTHAAKKTRAEVLGGVSFQLPLSLLWLPKKRDEIVAEIEDAVPAGGTRAQMEHARDRILNRVRQVDALVEAGLNAIPRAVERLAREYELGEPPATIAYRLKDPVREELWDDLEGTESTDQAEQLARRLVRDELDIN